MARRDIRKTAARVTVPNEYDLRPSEVLKLIDEYREDQTGNGIYELIYDVFKCAFELGARAAVRGRYKPYVHDVQYVQDTRKAAKP